MFSGADARGLRHGAERDGAVLLPERPASLSRHRRSSASSRRASAAATRQGLPVRAGLCDRARGRPSRAEPARHPAQGAAAAARRWSKAEANHLQVRVELQADCFAGVWAEPRRRSNGNFIEPGDVEAALQTAAAIGDDTLQRQGAGLRGAGQLHPRLGRAAPALVHDRLQGGHGQGLQHLRGGAQALDRTPPCPASTTSDAFVPLKIAVLTVSDTRELADDKSGATLAERIEKAGHAVGGARDRHRRRRENPRAGARPGSPIRRSTSSSRPAAPASPAAT